MRGEGGWSHWLGGNIMRGGAGGSTPSRAHKAGSGVRRGGWVYRMPCRGREGAHVGSRVAQVCVLLLAGCQASATHEVLQAAQWSPSPKKNHVTNKSPVGDISVATLRRTDTTLDHNRKAEKVCPGKHDRPECIMQHHCGKTQVVEGGAKWGVAGRVGGWVCGWVAAVA